MPIYWDGSYYYSRNKRTLFQYKFASQGGNGVPPLELFSEVQGVAESQLITGLHTPPASALRAWRGEPRDGMSTVGASVDC